MNAFRTFVLFVTIALTLVGINDYVQNNLVVGPGVYSGYFVVVGNYSILEGSATNLVTAVLVDGTAVVDGRVLPIGGNLTVYKPKLFTGMIEGTAVFQPSGNMSGYVVLAGNVKKVGSFYVVHGRAILTNVYLYYLK